MKKICVLMCLFAVSCTSNSDPTMGDEDMATKQVTNEISQIALKPQQVYLALPKEFGI